MCLIPSEKILIFILYFTHTHSLEDTPTKNKELLFFLTRFRACLIDFYGMYTVPAEIEIIVQNLWIWQQNECKVYFIYN